MPRNFQKPELVNIWSQDNCPACLEAKRFMENLSIQYAISVIDSEATKEQFFRECNNARTVPQIIVDGVLVGTLNDFKQYIGWEGV